MNHSLARYCPICGDFLAKITSNREKFLQCKRCQTVKNNIINVEYGFCNLCGKPKEANPYACHDACYSIFIKWKQLNTNKGGAYKDKRLEAPDEQRSCANGCNDCAYITDIDGLDGHLVK